MLLQMLLLVVEQPGQMTLSLLPAILDLSLNYVTPLLAQECNSSDFCDVAISLYALFDGYVCRHLIDPHTPVIINRIIVSVFYTIAGNTFTSLRY